MLVTLGSERVKDVLDTPLKTYVVIQTAFFHNVFLFSNSSFEDASDKMR